ncbi:UDP-N-acetylmuramate--L-alanine ligase [Patescibacteria group bacterium]|nr:UDP-N-acetylmuramate--L-alanine ligase [Patescibacteria group bacterium]MBU4579627.1 UDP-N-acetylmuramate--L-alanine ligase [Patescibacteria group bacterium]
MQKIDFNKARKIHFIGIGGIGLSAIAKLMLARGKIVKGSDVNKSEITEELKKAGAKIAIVQKAKNLADDTELVIYTLAILKNNPERVKAEKMKIPMLSYPEALAMLFNAKYGIAICGTHGKSTATSMIGLVLAGGGLDPNVVVGSKVPEFARFDSSESRRGGNLRIGKGKHFVIEACEYERAFLEYYPKIIILNNIELDHTDYYKDIEDYRSAFEEFIGHLSKDGVLICNGDDEQISKLKVQMSNQFQSSNVKIITFGFGENNDLRCRKMETENGFVKFWVNFNNNDFGEFILKLPGKFNVYNALGAIAAGLHLGIGAERIKKSLANFGGIWRRFEIKGNYKGALAISDYAHHPTAVKATIEAAREFYPGRRIFAVFQPHQHNRTKMLYKDFLKSFDSADELILAEIFDVAGREDKKDQNVSSRKMAEDIKKRNKKLASNIFYASNLAEARKLIDEKIQKGDILLIMGAGDIYKVADGLVEK